jgi:hypothetical protein
VAQSVGPEFKTSTTKKKKRKKDEDVKKREFLHIIDKNEN